MTTSFNRREFTKTGLGSAAGLSMVLPHTSAHAHPIGANESIRLGFVGVGNRGWQLVDAFSKHDDCQVVAAADVYAPYLDRFKSRFSQAQAFEDYRGLLEQNDIDAVVIATPDHWHALQTIHAVAAGKDVYVEKPLSTTIVEGRRMIEAANKFKRIVQVGLQRRSMSVFHQLLEYLNTQKLGKITVARAYRLNNMYPDGIGRKTATSPPRGLDWDLWLGPRPRRAYQDNIAPYKFRWWINYSSQMGNWGVHYFDVIRWLLGEAAPRSAVCIGGRFAVDDDRTIPDTAEAVFELPGGALLVFGQYEASSNPALAWGELELRGTQGTVYAGSSGFRVVTERPGQFQSKAPRAEAHESTANEPNVDATIAHTRNFLDCVKSRSAPRCTLTEGHRSTVFAHLANISMATGARLEWDAVGERFTNNKQANELLHYEYRKGFELPEF